MKIIAIANQKGGVAKTTTTAALAVLLSRNGTPVHMVDMDPQASLTRAFGLGDESDGLYHALMHRAALPVKTVSHNLTLTPSTIELGRAETERWHSVKVPPFCSDKVPLRLIAGCAECGR